MDLPNPYKGDYKKLVIVPISLAIISLILILFISPIRLGIDFKGGIDVEMLSSAPPNLQMLKSDLEKSGYTVNEIKTNKNPAGYMTQAELSRSKKMLKADELKSAYYTQRKEVAELEANSVIKNDSALRAQYEQKRLELDKTANSLFELSGSNAIAGGFSTTNLLTKQVQASFVKISDEENSNLRSIFASDVPDASTSFKEMSSSLSDDFISRAFMVVVYSIILTSIVVFLIFRSIVPSIAVLSGAAADVLFALGAMAIFQIPLTLASFAALLMLVGFSLDTDILLTMRVVKRTEGSAADRAYESMKTGMTMSMSVMVAFASLLALAYITQISIYYEIAAVAIAGLIGDLIATWAFNAVIILAYMQDMEKKGKTIMKRSLLSYIFRS
ncbi:MAG: hypothetical protein WC492_01465 [Candidatus Micrarchaeia archaeon]